MKTNGLTLLIIVAFSIILNAEEDQSLPKVKHMIDTHIHLYNTSREGGVPWPPKDDKVLHKPHLPKEFQTVSKPSGLTGAIIVEASHLFKDNKWALNLVEGNDYFVGLVGNVNPYRKDFESQIMRLKKDSRFVGVRARNGGKQKEINFNDPNIIKNFRFLAENGLSLDILTNGGGVDAVKKIDKLAQKIPNLHIIANHVIGYDFDGKAVNSEWTKAVESLAKNKNVWCKISGLYQRSVEQPAPKDINHYKETLNILWNNLGEDRLIYGSNWPCTKHSGNYKSYVTLVNQYFSTKSQEACEKYFWKNASHAYRLDLK